MSENRLWSGAFIGYGIANCMLFMSNYIMIATIPFIVMDVYDGTALEAGMAMTWFQIGTLCSRLVAGRIVDGFRKRYVLFFAGLLFFLTMLLFNFAASMEALFALRMLHGIAYAVGTTAVAAMAVLVLPSSRKGEGIGYFSVMGNISMAVGPLVGLLLLDAYGTDALFPAATIVGLICFVASNAPRIPVTADRRRNGAGGGFFEKNTLPWDILGVLASFAYTGILVFIPMFLKSIGAGADSGLFFTLMALSMVISRPIIGKVFDRVGASYVLYPGMVLFAASFALLASTDVPSFVLWAAPLTGIGYAALNPSFQALAVRACPIERAGTATGNYFFSLDFGVGAGSLLLSAAADVYGFDMMYALCGAVVVASLALYHFKIKRYVS